MIRISLNTIYKFKHMDKDYLGSDTIRIFIRVSCDFSSPKSTRDKKFSEASDEFKFLMDLKINIWYIIHPREWD